MKSILNKLLIFLSLLFCTISAAASNSYTFRINGLSNDLLSNVQNRLGVLQNSTNQNLNDFLSQANSNITKAMEPYGYFKPQIETQLIHLENQTLIQFDIHPGKPLLITSVSIQVIGEGKQNPTVIRYLQNFPIQKGFIFNATNYTQSKQHLFELALSQGYLNAYFVTQEIRISLKRNTCDVLLTLNTGPRYYFGPVQFNHTALSDSLLKRYIPFKTGEPFSSQKLLAFQDRLNSSSYFKRVSIKNNIDQAQNYNIPINVKLELQKMQQWIFGAGYGTDTGPRVTLGSNWRYINSSGHQINSQLMLSPVQSTLQASYIIPGSDPTRDQYSINAAYITNHLNQGDSTTEQLGINASTFLSAFWQQTLSLNYQIEQFTFIGQPEQNSYLFIPGVSWVYTNSNDKIFPTKGNRFLLSMQGSLENTISDTSFFQTEIQDKYITHFTDNDRLIARIDLGYTAVHDINDFPLSLRFYAGGTQSVRGFSYQGLGPGRYLGVGSLEFQQRITGKWYGAIFYDAGNAMDSLDNPLDRSAGVGLVFASPIGTMELTLAKALSLPGQPMRVQFTLGPDL